MGLKGAMDWGNAWNSACIIDLVQQKIQAHAATIHYSLNFTST